MSSAPTPAPPDTAALASATEALYRAALGPGRTADYLPVFARFDERGLAGTHWNHAAAWLNLNWLLYRRLWRQALLYALALAVALGLWWWARGFMAVWPAGVRWGLLASIGVLAVVVPGWWGTAWLHADVRRRMTEAVRRARTVQEACGLLQRGGPGRWAWVLALLAQVALLGTLGLRTGGGPVAAAPEPVLAPRAVAEAPAPPPAPVAAPAPPPSTEGVVEPVSPVSPAVSSGGAVVVGAVTSEAPTPAPALAKPAVAESTPAPAAPAAAPPAPGASGDSAGTTDAPRPRWHGHGVNVGIFGDPANAERAATRLRQAGLPVRSDPVESARGPLTRVRVGPFQTREQAEAAAETVRNLGLEARVFGP
ncbi:SPOR domain-containing protein [Hydrogenophaga sp. YM1]|uniref:SPOR domain-containing protein n=1 Tax=Hydrogenophaga sp. YM1 TaxID=2806262 RepID=UPI00195734D9|nr:SPOR domain-containing protein [Hydrogenophaga sp. YM1]QRR34897.1 SPOR domain-containing protein [Hydrogenophaga sp. YM1]